MVVSHSRLTGLLCSGQMLRMQSGGQEENYFKFVKFMNGYFCKNRKDVMVACSFKVNMKSELILFTLPS